MLLIISKFKGASNEVMFVAFILQYDNENTFVSVVRFMYPEWYDIIIN